MKTSYLKKARPLLLIWLLWLLGPCLAFAQPNSTRVYKIVNHANGKVLDVKFFGDYLSDYAIYLRDYTGSASQQWKFMPSRANGTGIYEIINRSSGKVLTAPFSNGGSVVSQYDRTGVIGGVQTNTRQLWQLRRAPLVSPTSYQVVVHSSSQFLTGDPFEPVAIWDYQSTNYDGTSREPYQVWDLVDVSPNPTSNLDLGVYAITNVRSSYLLEGGNGDETDQYGDTFGFLASKYKVTQTADAGVAGQEWTFVPSNLAPGYFRIINRVNQLALEIGGAAQNQLYNQGRQANLWDNWGGPNQAWGLFDIYTGQLLTLAQARDGRPCIMLSYHTGQCLEMGGGGLYPLQVGRIPNQWPYVGDDNQMWYIQYRTANRNGKPVMTANPATAGASQMTALNSEKAAGIGTLALYPNPAQSTVTLSLPDGAVVHTVLVSDLRGAQVSGALYRGDGQLDVAALAPGIYLVSVSDGTHTYRQKLLKQ